MTTLNNIIGDYQKFLDDILARVTEEGFDLDDFVQIDHLCYRVPSLDGYHQKKEECRAIGSLLGETMVNGRPIATFRLHEPIRSGQWRIDALEVPAPKEGHPVAEGLEHIEFVLYDDFQAFLKKYPGKPYNMASADRGINPEIGLKLNGYGVKFHLLNLPTVVYLEHKLGMHDIRDGQ
ncbi:MAG TPA: VOC family protein [Patescibacteria group bacterium]|nr:VOC family protein [Patescibacteria group bacterium]